MSRNFLVQPIFFPTNFLRQKSEKCPVEKLFWSKKYSGQKKFWPKDMLVQRYLGPQKLGSKRLFKIESVTAEVLLIWANVTKKYVNWTNLTVTVGI